MQYKVHGLSSFVAEVTNRGNIRGDNWQLTLQNVVVSKKSKLIPCIGNSYIVHACAQYVVN